MQTAIRFRERLLTFELNWQSNDTLTFCGWDCLWLGVCFPFTEQGLCTELGQLENREEQFAEFDKKCIGLEDFKGHRDITRGAKITWETIKFI